MDKNYWFSIALFYQPQLTIPSLSFMSKWEREKRIDRFVVHEPTEMILIYVLCFHTFVMSKVSKSKTFRLSTYKLQIKTNKF